MGIVAGAATLCAPSSHARTRSRASPEGTSLFRRRRGDPRGASSRPGTRSWRRVGSSARDRAGARRRGQRRGHSPRCRLAKERSAPGPSAPCARPRSSDCARELGLSGRDRRRGGAKFADEVRRARAAAAWTSVSSSSGAVPPPRDPQGPARANACRIVVVGTMGGGKVELTCPRSCASAPEVRGTMLRSRPLEEKILAGQALAAAPGPAFRARAPCAPSSTARAAAGPGGRRPPPHAEQRRRSGSWSSTSETASVAARVLATVRVRCLPPHLSQEHTRMSTPSASRAPQIAQTRWPNTGSLP